MCSNLCGIFYKRSYVEPMLDYKVLHHYQTVSTQPRNSNKKIQFLYKTEWVERPKVSAAFF